MSPKNTEDTPLQKTEKEKRRTDELLKELKKRKFFHISDRELTERLKKYPHPAEELKKDSGCGRRI